MVSKVEDLLEMFAQTTNSNLRIILFLQDIHVSEHHHGVEEAGAALPGEALHLLQDGAQGQQHLADVPIITVCKTKTRSFLPVRID